MGLAAPSYPPVMVSLPSQVPPYCGTGERLGVHPYGPLPFPHVRADAAARASKHAASPSFVWQSPRLWVPRDAPESDPVSNRRFVDVLQPLRVAKLAGPCDCGLYCSLARRRAEDSRRSNSAEPYAVSTRSEFLHLTRLVGGRATSTKARNCEAKNEQRSHRACPGACVLILSLGATSNQGASGFGRRSFFAFATRTPALPRLHSEGARDRVALRSPGRRAPLDEYARRYRGRCMQ